MGWPQGIQMILRQIGVFTGVFSLQTQAKPQSAYTIFLISFSYILTVNF